IFIYNVFGAMLIVYLCGVTYLSFVSNLPWGPTALSALTFIPADLIKVVIAGAITLKVNQSYPIIVTDKYATTYELDYQHVDRSLCKNTSKENCNLLRRYIDYI